MFLWHTIIMSIPETLVLLITTHGSIPTDNGEPVRIKVPDGMKITKVAVAQIGVCNVTTETQVNLLSKYITEILGDDFSDEKLNDTMEFIREFQSSMKTKVKSQLKGEKDDEMQEFIRYGDKPQTLYTYTSGQELLDKRYSRSTEENLERAFDYKINMLNVKGKPDLFQYMMTGQMGSVTRSTTQVEGVSVNLSDIVGFLKDRGVKHLIVFDLSCSIIQDLNPRDIRAKRRRLEVEGVSGGRRKKTKTRKTKRSKSNTTWKRSSQFSRNTLRSRRS